MTSKNNNILVSSSFEGRDKSLIKSILNIDNQYDDLILAYTDHPSDYSIYLTNDDQHYYAKIKDCKSTISIGPELNPKTVISLFNHLAESQAFNILDQQTYNSHSVVEHVYTYLNSTSDQLMEIKDADPVNGFHLILDCKNKQVYSNQLLTDTFSLTALNTSVKNLRINFLCGSENHLRHSMPLTDFKWKLGMILNDDALHFEFKSKQHMIKLLAWPDYGHFPYQKEYLQLSSLLFKHKLTYIDLIEQTHLPEQVVVGFLNANILLDCLTLVPNENNRLRTLSLKPNEFIKSLKSFFSHPLSFRT